MTSSIPSSEKLTNLYSVYKVSKDKEKLGYQALSAVIDFSRGLQRHLHVLDASQDFAAYKHNVLSLAAQFKHPKKLCHGQEDPQFNVTHYVRAILRASDENYRNMAIQAALKDLNQLTLDKLIVSLRKKCLEISKKVKALQVQVHKLTKVERKAQNSLQSMSAVVLPEEEAV